MDDAIYTMKNILFVLLFALVNCQSTIMITFDTPSNFTLTSDMYYYADSFIIEMWGAGASGGCSCSCNYRYGGGGGSYIKALIYQNDFNVSIGQGGHISLSDNYCPSQPISNGKNTSLTNQDINLIAGGGYGNSTGGKIFSLISHNYDNTIYINQSGQSGGIGCLSNCGLYVCNGGSSPFGGQGGSQGGIGGYYPNNGSFPGGGGGGQIYGSYTSQCNNSGGYCSNVPIAAGANGGIIIYLTPKIQTSSTSYSTSSSISCSISPSILSSHSSSHSSSTFQSTASSTSPSTSLILPSHSSSTSSSTSLILPSHSSSTSSSTSLILPSTTLITTTLISSFDTSLISDMSIILLIDLIIMCLFVLLGIIIIVMIWVRIRVHIKKDHCGPHVAKKY